MRKVVLASTSKPRAEIFAKLGIPFRVHASEYHEDMTLDMSPKKLVQHLALGKARAVAAHYSDAVVIGADTIISLGNKIYGKPGTTQAARALLTKLSGKKNYAITGFAIVDSKTGRSVSCVEVTSVYFRHLTKKEIEQYVKTGEPQRSGGGYHIDGGAAGYIHRIEGDYYSVVGLPLSALKTELKKFGVT